MKNVLIKTSETAVKPDKNGRNYKTVEFTPVGATWMDVPGLGRVAVTGKVRSTKINLFEKSYLDEKPDTGYNEAIGTPIFGNVETREVEPFTFEGRHPVTKAPVMRNATQYTTVVIPPNGLESGSPGYETYVKSVFKNRKHVVVSSTPISTPSEPVINETPAKTGTLTP